MFGKKRDDNGEKVYRYSIRKYHFGAASVAIAALIFFANGVAKADMAVSPATANSTHQTAAGGGGDSSGDSGSAGDPNDQATTTNSTSEVTTPTRAGISTGTTSVENPVVSDSSNHSENVESTTSNVSEKTEIPTVTTGKAQGDVTSTEAKKVNVTDLKTALEELESKVASITDEAKKAKLNAVIAEAKKVLEDKNATQEQIDSQVTLVKDAVKSVQEVAKKGDETKPSEENRSATVEAPNREITTPARSPRGRRGRNTDVQPKSAGGSNLEAETAPEALPTYTNGAGTYKLAEEMKNIVSIMKANGADETTIAAVKANYDKLNDTLGAHEDGVLSEADFAAATANLTAARDAVEKVLDKKFEEYARTVNPDARSRQARQARETGRNFQDSREYYFEDGKTGISPYSKYTYVFHNYRPTNILDFEHQPISNAEKYILARVAPTDNGFLWTISVNSGRFSNTTNDSYWFTIPKGQTYKAGTARVDAQSLQGSTPYYGDGTIEGAMRQAGLRAVNRGANLKGVVRYGKVGANAYWTDDFKSLATQSVNALTDKGLYLPTLAQDSEKQLAQAKFDKINKKGGDLFYFEQPDNVFKYTITFETEGAPNDPDKNDPEELVYAAGFKGVTRADKVYRVLVNQWHAVTDSERRDIDRYRMTLKNGGTFIVEQGKYYNKLWPYADALGPKGWYGSKNLNSDIKKVDGIITAGDQSNFTAIDFFSYVNYKLRDGKDFEGMKFEANNHGQKFTFYREDGTEITTKQLGAEAGGTPGEHVFYYKRVFTSDGSSDNGKFRFLVKPNNPVFNPTMKLAGDKQILTASGGTKGIPMTLFREYTDATGTHVVPVETKEADNNGTVTFNGENNGGVTLEKGKYFVRTVINTDSYKDYSGKTQTTLESDPATEDKKFEVVEPPVVKINGKKLTENAEDNQFIIYKGANFNPTFQVENDGKQVNYLKATNIPNGVWFNNVNGRDQEKTNMASGSTFTLANNTVDNIAKNGEATVTVRNHKNQEKVYKFKYIIADVQPKDTPKDKLVGETLGDPHSFVKAVVNGNEGDQYFPGGMSFTWETNNNQAPGNNTVLGEAGRITNYNAKVTFPANGPYEKTIDNVRYTIYGPSPKKIPVTFNVTDNVAPTVKIVDKTKNNTETVLTDSVSDAPTIDVYRGATLELPLKYYDNATTGRVNISYVNNDGIPRGVWFNKDINDNRNVDIKETGKTQNTEGNYTVIGRVDATARLGISTVTLKVSDAASGDANQGNSKEVKFRVRVLDLDFEQGESAQAGVSKITKELEINQATGDPNNYLTVNDGAQRSDSLFPTGMTFRYIRDTEYRTNLTYTTPGKHIEKVAAFYPKTYVPTNGESVTAPNATGDKVGEILGRAYVSRNIEFQVKPTAPTVTAKENGDVVVAHTNQTNVNKLSFTYTDVSGAQQTVTATKNRNSWTLDNTSIDGVTINATSGEVTIKDRAVRDATDVTAKVVTSDEVNSNNTTTASGAGERVAPEFSFDGTNTTLENGARTVYVTPTETNSFKLGTVTDNSKKIIESRLSSDLDYGLSYEGKLVKTANREETAPKDIVITGKLDRTNKSNSGNRWNDGDQIVTRYVVATDASGNVLNNPTNTPSNPTRVVFKVLTQATKYTPQVATQAINKDITANGATLTDTEFNAIKSKIKFTTTKGAVKVAYDTTDMAITMNDRGAIKRNSDGTYYVGATVTYPDKTTDTIQIPVEKSDKLPPTVKMNGIDLTETADDNHFIIYKGAKFNPTFEVNDNSGTTTYLKAEGIPNGVWFNRQGERDFPKENMRNGTQYQLSTNNTVDSIEPLGDHEARVIVKDALNNEKTYKFKYTIVDVDVKDSPKNVRLNSQLGQPQRFLTTTAANRVNSGDKYFPDGMRYKWIKNNQDVVQTTPLSKSGTITDYKVVAEFANGERTYTKNIDGKNVTIYAPAKIEKTVTFIVTEDSPPTVKMTNPSNNQITELSGDDSNSPIVTIYRKGQLNIPLSFYDNEATGRVNLQYVEGLPKGVSFGANNTVSVTGAVANANKTHIISGRVDPDAKLGMSTVTMKVSDGANGVDSGNQGEVKFRIRVLDVDFEEAKSAEENRSSITVEVNVGEQISDPNYYLTVNDGTVRRDNRDYRTEGPELDRFPSGMTFRYVSSDGSSTTRKLQYDAPGQYTVKARAYFPGNHAATNGVSEVVSGQTGDNAEINGRRYIEKTIVFRVKPTAPVVTPQDNGDVTITQRNETNVNRLSVTYTTQGDNPEEVTYTASKNGTTWSFVDGTPISIDGATGTIKIKDRLVQDGSTVKVKAIVSRDTGDVASDEASGDAKPGDALYPTIDFQNEETDSSGNRVVYITPTETTNLDVATVSDNSNKLLEAVFFDQGAKVTDLGNYGITYNKVTRNGDTITNAPYTLTVTGTLNREKSANTVWNDDDVITTRYASAMDAAENNIKDKSGSRDNVASNPYRVVFKVRTQAAKYTPTVSKSKIERDITQANATITDPEFNKIKETLTFSSTRGEVKVKKDTTGLTFEIKNRTVQAKQDGSLYITATVVYPDGSRDDIDVPLDTTDANKAKPALTTKEVSIKAAKAKEQQGSVPSTEYNRVLSNVTVPQGQPQPTAKEVKNNGLISEVDGKKVVTVGLTFKDNTKKDVTVPVLEVKPVDITTTFNELDNSVTVKPNTRVEEGDKLHVTIRGVGMELTKTATGYTSNRDDREFTVSDDGSIAIRLLGNETFQAGDRVVTRHESNKNGKVDSYETEAFAGLKPVEKVPAINLTNLTPKEIEAVKAAVKKANPSVNVSELQVAPNGDVTYTHRGEGVGENDSVPTLNLRETVRERNDAEKIDPTVKTLTRHDQQPKHTDENVKDAVTGANIKSKELLDPIPDESGNVRVKVTYDDDSSETVTVPITVTPSKATQEDPTVKTLTRHDQQPKHTDENVKDAVTGANIKSKELLDPIPDESGNVRVKVTYDDDSSETVTVPITVTPSKATQEDPTVKTLTRHDQQPKHTDENVKDAVTGANIKSKELLDPIPDESGNVRVKVTYDDDSSETVTVPITVTPSKATQEDPTVKTLTRHDQQPKHTDENVKDAVTGANIKSKELLDPIPDESGNVRVKVTYDDDSSETVTVPITVTPSKATQEDPTVKTLTRHDQQPKHTDENVKDAVTGANIKSKELLDPIPDESGNVRVKVTYDDDSSETVTVPITVTPSKATQEDPTVKTLTRHDQQPKHTDENVKDAVTGANIKSKELLDPIPDESGNVRVKVTYDDDSSETVTVPITVTPSKATQEDPTVKTLTRHDQQPKHTDENVKDAVTGANIKSKELLDPIPDESGNVRVKVTYDDDSSETVTVPITVTPSKATQEDPTVKTLTRHDQQPKHTDENVKDAVTGANIKSKELLDPIPDESGNVRVKVTYDDDSSETVTVPITVTPSKATQEDPTVKTLTRHDQQPKHTDENVKDAVTGANIKSKELLDPIPDESGNVRVKVTYDDDSSETVTVPITVTPSKATQEDPTVTSLTRHDQQPKHTDENVKDAVTGANIKSKELLDPIPDESGNVRVKVTYDDDSSETVTVPITVVGLPKAKVPVESFGNLTKEEQDKVKESVEKANPGKTVVVEPSGKVIITDPKTNVSHEISEELVTTIAPPVVDIPEFNGGVNGEPEKQEELPEFNGGVNGEPEVQPDLPEFNGGVNGELPDPTELPKVQLIITKWIDENGNELKPADAKAPAVLGEANEAFEHGEIEGYVFVRTETKGDVVTHVFRKVSPVRPTGDGQQRPATPSDDTNPRPDTSTPAEVPTTQPAEQPSQTVEVPAQLPNEVSETNPSVSQPQAVLPNTGTQEDRATGAFGVLSLLGAFGLLFAKKKKDDEEEA